MIIEPGLAKITGFLKIFDPNSGETFVDKCNAINYENISIAMLTVKLRSDNLNPV